MPDPTLLLLDLQEAICRPDGAVGGGGLGAEAVRRGVLEHARTVRDHFRARNWPIVYVMVAFDDHYTNLISGSSRFAGMRKAGLLRRSDPSTRICTEVEPRPEDPVIVKGCVNPFVGTHLTELLHRLRPDELVLGGVATNHVVESTARYAADSGYRVVVLEDLCASFSEAAHKASVEFNLPMYARLQSAAEYMQQ